MKVLSLVGSPRVKGNSAIASQKALKLFKDKGHETREIYISKLKIAGCTACNQCRKKGKCVIKDDYGDLLAQIQESDIFIISAPIYFGRVPGTVKNFIDRCYSLFDDNYKSSIKPGIRCLFITVSHAPPEVFADEVNYLEKWFVEFMKFQSAEKVVIGKCGDMGDIEDQEDDIKRIEKACNRLMN